MNIENQIVSLELARKLKELGVKQESIFWWDIETTSVMKSGLDGMPRFLETSKVDKRQRDYVRKPERTISGFTVAELGEMLPEFYGSRRIADNR